MQQRKNEEVYRQKDIYYSAGVKENKKEECMCARARLGRKAENAMAKKQKDRKKDMRATKSYICTKQNKRNEHGAVHKSRQRKQKECVYGANAETM